MSSERIRVHVKLMSSNTGNSVTVAVEKTMRVEDFRKLIAETFHFGENDFKIIFRGKVLHPGQTLNDYNLEDDTVVQVLPSSSNRPQREDPPPPNIQAPPNQPRPPQQPRESHLTDDPEVFKLTCELSSAIADLQSEIAQFQKLLLTGTEQEAKNRAVDLIQKMGNASVVLRRSKTNLARAAGLTVVRQITGQAGGDVANMVNETIRGVLNIFGTQP